MKGDNSCDSSTVYWQSFQSPTHPSASWGHLIGLLLMLPGHATFRNLSRYSSYHEKTFARQFARPFDFVALNKAAILTVVPVDHEQALALDASFIAKSGKQTYGLDRFWNSCHGRAERGLEVSVLAWSISPITAPIA